MSTRPDFTADQVRELKSLGLCDEQVGELRTALSVVRRTLFKPAARNAVKAVLKDVEKRSTELMQVLAAIAVPSDAARGEALGRIEEGYWQGDRMDDDGPTSMHHLIPRLHALAVAARDGVATMPSGPTRYSSADPRPVNAIDRALLYGWTKAYGPRVGTTYGHETLADMVADAKANPPAPPYPAEFDASRSPGCVFSRVVGICYAAVGGNPDPDRAIRNYLEIKRATFREAMEAFEEGVKSAARKPK
ncbi:hypothetical protein ACVCL0_14225 [Rhodanobacter sp. UC4450_H17]